MGAAPAAAPAPPRVLHVIPSLDLGGTPRLALDLVASLRARGRYPSRLCVLGSADRDDPGYRPPPDTLYLGFPGRYRDLAATARCAAALRRAIRAEGAAIVHSYQWLADVLAAAVVPGTGARHASHIVDRREMFRERRFRARVNRAVTVALLRRSGARFLAVSDACREFFAAHAGFAAADVTVARNSIDPAPFRAAAAARSAGAVPRIGAACRLVEEKGLAHLVEAAARLRAAGRAFRVRVAGEGPLARELVRLVAERGLEEVVEFAGRVDSVPGFLAACDLFAVPSVYAEGLPGTILEAMAAGCAVVASDVGGAREAIVHGESGWLVPPADAAALAEGLGRLVDDAALRARLAAAGRATVEREFSLEAMTDRVEAFYAGILAGGRR